MRDEACLHVDSTKERQCVAGKHACHVTNNHNNQWAHAMANEQGGGVTARAHRAQQ